MDAKSAPSGIVKFARDHQMVTIKTDGTKTIGTEADALVWISKHVQTGIHAEAVIGGMATKMIDGSFIVFVAKGPVGILGNETNFIHMDEYDSKQ